MGFNRQGIAPNANQASTAIVLTAGFALLPMLAAPAKAQHVPSFSVLYTFKGQVDGGVPLGGLIRDDDGNLYGTTYGGGQFGSGVVFKLDSQGKETVLHAFSGGTDGANPESTLIRDRDGNLYGTTIAGGIFGFGLVFKLAANGNETVLYAFTGGPDGGAPMSGLIRDEFGNLYGTAITGGDTSNSCPFGQAGCGVVFKVDPSGNETVLHAFSGAADGASPDGDLIRDDHGDLYSTTQFGGNTTNETCLYYGCGVVFKLDQWERETVLHTFSGGTDGSSPDAGLTQDAAGNLYGTTGYGGYAGSSCPNGSTGCGVVFKLDRGEKETVLHAFTGGTDGFQPFAGLILKGGYLFGATSFGGVNGYCCGGLFELDRSGSETVLHTFNGPDGASPAFGSLFEDGNSLYGTVSAGGSYGQGVVFKVQAR